MTATTPQEEGVPVALTILSARVVVGGTDDHRVESTISYNGTRLNGDQWQVVTVESDAHGPERRQLVEEISGTFEDAKELALRHAIELYRLLAAKREADAAFDALFSGDSETAPDR